MSEERFGVRLWLGGDGDDEWVGYVDKRLMFRRWRAGEVVDGFELSREATLAAAQLLAGKAAEVASVWHDVVNERVRQDIGYPDCRSLPDGTGGGGRETWMKLARNACDRAYREGRLTHADVFDEESAEVLAETNQAKLRGELLQVMAVCSKWIADIDSRSK